MWFLYSHIDQEHEFFDNKEEALTEYREWRDRLKNDLCEAKEKSGHLNEEVDLMNEMIILSKVVHGIRFDETKRGGFEVIK